MESFYKVSFIKHLKCGLVFLYCVGWIFFPGKIIAKEDPEVDFDEILIYVQLSKFGGADIPAAIREKTVFLSVTDLFDFLQIKNSVSGKSILHGFILNQQDEFTIDPVKETFLYQGQEHVLASEDFIWQEGRTYLKSSIYGEIFGLNCSFDYRTLSVSLSTELDLPVFRLKRQEMLRKNLDQLQENITSDTVFDQKRSLAKLAIMDWGITNINQFSSGNSERQSLQNVNYSRINLSLGGELAYGEVMGSLRYVPGIPIQSREQIYQWRYVNNDQALAKQVIVGRINTQATSTLFAPVTGIKVTNASTLRKKSFGYYRISDHTEPEWMVELYVNNLLIDYVQADATGLYSFEIPLMYGNSAIQLKFYGPHGEESSKKQFLNIPFNFVPTKELEYTISAGWVEDGKGSILTRGSFNYGLSNKVTIGVGVEYLSSLAEQPLMPFVYSSLRIAEGLLFSGEYIPGVRSNALINYRLPSGLQVDLTYTKLEEGQKALFYNYLEERKLALSMPFRSNNFSLFSRLSFNQMVYPTSKFTTGQLLLSSMLFGVNTQLTTYGTFRENSTSHVQTLISQTHRLPHDFSFTPQLQYHYNARQISLVMAKLEKRVLSRGFLNVFYQNNLQYNSTSFGIGFRYNFSFANTSMQMRQSNDHTYFTQTLNGSLMVDGNSGHLDFDNKVNVGKGAITVLPFLDLNANGIRDENESLVAGLKLKVQGGKVNYDKKGETIRISNLMAYKDYILELDRSSFDHIAWRIKNATIKVSVSPNQFRNVEVPISVMGEAAGMLYLENELNGMGRIKINFYNDQNQLIHTALTAQDGYFSYTELPPGDYKIMPDTVQLQKLGYTFQAEKTNITIVENVEGFYFDDLEFTLYKTRPGPAGSDSTVTEVSPNSAKETVGAGKLEEPSTEKNPSLLGNNEEEETYNGKLFQPESDRRQHQILEKDRNPEIPFTGNLNAEPADRLDSLIVREEKYRIQVMATKNRVENTGIFEAIEGVTMSYENGFYKYQSRLYTNHIARIYLDKAKQLGFKDAFIVFPRSKNTRIEKIQRKDTVYMIQLLASPFKVPLDHPHFKGLPGVTEENQDHLYKYTYHTTPTVDGARKKLKMLKALGFKDAFVVTYSDGKRLVTEEISIPAQLNNGKDRHHPVTHFKIQIRSSDKMLDQGDPVFNGVKGIDFYIHHDKYKYTYGEAQNYRNAILLLDKVRDMGFEDAFIVSFHKKSRAD